MKALLHVVGIAVGAGACLLIVIALATTGWSTFGTFETGLFQVCGNACASYSPDGPQAAVRFMVVAGFLLTIAGVSVAILYYVRYVKNDIANTLLPLVAAMCLLAAGGACILGAIIWAAKVKPDLEKQLRVKTHLAYSFGMDIVGAILAFVGGALIMVQRSRPE